MREVLLAVNHLLGCDAVFNPEVGGSMFAQNTSKLAQAVTILTCIWAVLDSNLEWDTDYSHAFSGSTQALQANAGIVPLMQSEL
jgi:hypothetical protein